MKINILGVGVTSTELTSAVSQILQWIQNGKKSYVSVCTVHTLMECQQNSEMFQAVNRADMATPDGMPLVWLNKLYNFSDRANIGRVYGPDLMLALCEHSVEYGYKHYFYGGSEGVPELLGKTLQKRFPGLQVAGAFSPPYRPLTDVEDAHIVAEINKANPDIIWVGLGTPKQDLWMAAHRNVLNASVLIAVGAAFDFHTGRVPQAPRWMQKNGLEWLFRLLSEPRRLWRRYLIYNPLFVFLVLLQALGLRKY